MGRDKTSRVLFVWAIRDAAHMSWVRPALLAALNSPVNSRHPLDIDVRIFITQGTASKASESVDVVDEKASSNGSDSDGPTTRPITSDSTETLVSAIEGGGGRILFSHGRPDVRKIINEELAASDGLQVSVDGQSPYSD